MGTQQRQFNEAIKSGDLRRVYLLCGEQAYLRLQNRDKLVKVLMGDGDSMNLSRYSGSDVTAKELIEMAQTLPFFADRRVIVLESTGLLNPKAASKSVTGSKSAASISEEAEKIADFIPEIPDSTAIVFVEENIDKRGKLYKAIAKSKNDKLGDILECVTPGENDLRSWAGGVFRKNGFSINGRALALFLEFTGEDMQYIAGEAEKLCCYCMGQGEITDQAIRDVCSPRIKDRIFDIKIKELSGSMADSEIARKVGVPAFVISKKYKPALRQYSTAELVEALSECVDADYESKSGKIDAAMAVEMIIVRHSGRG